MAFFKKENKRNSHEVEIPDAPLCSSPSVVRIERLSRLDHARIDYLNKPDVMVTIGVVQESYAKK